MLHQLLFVQQVYEVAEGVEPRASRDDDDLPRFGMGEFQSLSLGLTKHQFFYGPVDDSLSEPPSLVQFEKDRN